MDVSRRLWIWVLLIAVSLATPHRLQAADAAIVNGKAISTEDVENSFRRTSLAKKKVTDEQRKTYLEHVLRFLIDDVLVNQYLDERKVVADEAAVDKHIEDMTKQLVSKGKTLNQFLTESAVTPERMRSDIRNIYRWLAFVKSQSTPEALREYFDANKSAFDGSMVRASHILVKLPPDASASDKQAGRKKIEAIRAQLSSGADFAGLAKAYSECPSKDQGGDLDFFPRKGVMAEPFAAAAFALPTSHISEVVETEYGYHLIKTTDRQPGKTVSYDEVAEEVEALFAEDLRTAVVAKMRASADIKMVR